jgi:hypothetical protein
MSILKFEEYLLNETTSYDKYLKDEKYMIFFKSFKNKVVELFPHYNTSNLDLLISNVYDYYKSGYDINDIVNKLYSDGFLYKFTTSGLDQ